MSKNHVRRPARLTMPLLALDPFRGVTVDIIADVFPAWRTWNSATIAEAAQ